MEIEIQVQIEKSRKLVGFLKTKAKTIGKHRQIDSYYSPAGKTFVKVRPVKEWLRIRNADGKYSINYKNWQYEKDGRSHYCDEYETTIGDPKQLEKILRSLKNELLVVVDKVRTTYRWKNYEIDIDKIRGLGEFVEIEYKGKKTTKKPAQITAEMIEFLRTFDVGEIKRNYGGYPFQILFPKEVEYEYL